MVSMGVSFVVPRMTTMASFCTLSSLIKLDCDRVVRPRPQSMTLSVTAGTDDAVQCLLKPWLLPRTVLSCTRVLLIRPASCT